MEIILNVHKKNLPNLTPSSLRSLRLRLLSLLLYLFRQCVKPTIGRKDFANGISNLINPTHVLRVTVRACEAFDPVVYSTVMGAPVASLAIYISVTQMEARAILVVAVPVLSVG